MKVKRPTPLLTVAFLALFSLVYTNLANKGNSAQAAASSGKKQKRKHKSSYTNMSLVPPPPPSVAIPAGMLLSVPPPPAMSLLPVQFNPCSYQAQASTPHRCAHCGFSDSTYLAPTQSSPASYFKPFPKRTFYNSDTYTSIRRNRSRKTQSEKQTRKFKRRKCIFAAQ